MILRDGRTTAIDWAAKMESGREGPDRPFYREGASLRGTIRKVARQPARLGDRLARSRIWEYGETRVERLSRPHRIENFMFDVNTKGVRKSRWQVVRKGDEEKGRGIF